MPTIIQSNTATDLARFASPNEVGTQKNSASLCSPQTSRLDPRLRGLRYSRHALAARPIDSDPVSNSSQRNQRDIVIQQHNSQRGVDASLPAKAEGHALRDTDAIGCRGPSIKHWEHESAGIGCARETIAKRCFEMLPSALSAANNHAFVYSPQPLRAEQRDDRFIAERRQGRPQPTGRTFKQPISMKVVDNQSIKNWMKDAAEIRDEPISPHEIAEFEKNNGLTNLRRMSKAGAPEEASTRNKYYNAYGPRQVRELYKQEQAKAKAKAKAKVEGHAME